MTDNTRKEYSTRHHFSGLAASLLDFSAAMTNNQDELVDYLSEHLYIQLCMASGQARDAGELEFFSACRNVYYAEDEAARRHAVLQAQAHLAA